LNLLRRLAKQNREWNWWIQDTPENLYNR
jgi:hypothetical protein